jgi:pimeloyl-ACP methyl ester carboxylesterase
MYELLFDFVFSNLNLQGLKYDKNPIEFAMLKSLAEAQIPILIVYGDSDPIVPFEENGQILAARYHQLVAQMDPRYESLLLAL